MRIKDAKENPASNTENNQGEHGLLHDGSLLAMSFHSIVLLFHKAINIILFCFSSIDRWEKPMSESINTTALPETVNCPQGISEKQPRGLYLLFFTELWERFGFYTIQTIIILYMTKALMMKDTHANLLYAAFSSLLYLTPIIGGYLADRYLGFQRAIILGGALFIIGYFVCAFENQAIFILGLSIIICANGLFKPNVSGIVGELYEKNDPRRDGGFTLFYMGINIGALIPPLIAGVLVTRYGWHSGFLLAAAGMIIGQLMFQFGRKKYLGQAGNLPKRSRHPVSLTYRFYGLLFTGIIISIGLCQLAFQYPMVTNYLVGIAAAVVLLVILFYLSKESLLGRKKMGASLILIVISVAFWSLYNQTFTSLMLFADRNMEKTFLGIPFDAEATQFFNPFFIIALSPILSRFWIKLDRIKLNPSTQMKFFLGVLFMCFGYFLLAWGASHATHQGLTSSWWLAASYLLQTIAELLISPIGLAMITVLSPKHLVGMMMGVWFFAQAASFVFAGVLANIAAVPAALSPEASLPVYAHAFTVYGFIALIMAVVSYMLVRVIDRMIKE